MQDRKTTLIYETENFTLEIHPKPFVSREEGGHIKVVAKDKVITDRTMFTPQLALEFVWLSTVGGKALEIVMNKQNIPIIKINYEELGNWAYKESKLPTFHLHIFGRSKDAKVQIFPEAIKLPARETGFYDNFEPLTTEEMQMIHNEIVRLEQTRPFSRSLWKFNS